MRLLTCLCFIKDHYTYKFVSDQAFEEKRRQDKFAREAGGGRMKVVAVQTGAWLEFTCSAIGVSGTAFRPK